MQLAMTDHRQRIGDEITVPVVHVLLPDEIGSSERNAHDAQVSKVEDRAYIVPRIEALEGGFDGLNKRVKAAMRAWLADAAGDAAGDSREGRLVGVQGEAVLVQVDGRIERLTDGSPWRIAWPADTGSDPGGVQLDVEAEAAGTRALTATYQIDGPRWQASHTGRFDAETGELSLTTMAVIDNGGGARLSADRAWLVAGEVSRAGNGGPQPVMMARSEAKADAASGPQSTDDTYRYALDGGIDVPGGATRAVAIMAPHTFEASAEPVTPETDEPYQLALTRVGYRHTIMQQGEDYEENREFWESVPPLYWRHQILATKPAAVVLAYARTEALPELDEAAEEESLDQAEQRQALQGRDDQTVGVAEEDGGGLHPDLQVVLAVGDVRDHAAPESFALVVATRVQLPDQAKSEPHCMLTDGIGIHACGVGQKDAPLTQALQWKLVVASADGLDIAKPRTMLQKLIVPEAGDHQHVGLRQAGKSLPGCPGLLVADAGVELPEALCHLVGGVGEQDVGL